MARISYIDEHSAPALAEQIQRIRAARRGKLIPVYGLLLHSPEMADAWMSLVNAVRWQTHLNPRMREMAVLRVAYLNRAQYVIDVHRGHFTEADGVSASECDALLQHAIPAGVFDSKELDIIRYIDAVTLDVQVPPAVFDAARAQLTERQILELSVLIGVYNMHTRVICALEIDREVPDEPLAVAGTTGGPTP
jgi:4-carboxymuconolactone decarboxylase